GQPVSGAQEREAPLGDAPLARDGGRDEVLEEVRRLVDAGLVEDRHVRPEFAEDVRARAGEEAGRRGERREVALLGGARSAVATGGAEASVAVSVPRPRAEEGPGRSHDALGQPGGVRPHAPDAAPPEEELAVGSDV